MLNIISVDSIDPFLFMHTGLSGVFKAISCWLNTDVVCSGLDLTSQDHLSPIILGLQSSMLFETGRRKPMIDSPRESAIDKARDAPT